MIEEFGRVVAVEPGFAWVETQVKTSCGSCVANNDCGTGLIAKTFTPKPEQLRLATPSPLAVGQSVKIGIPEQHLLIASSWLYIVPLLALLLSALLFQALGLGEGGLILLSFSCTFITYWLVARRLKRDAKIKKYAPVFLGATHEPIVSRKHEIPAKKL